MAAFRIFPFPEGMSPNLRAAEVLAHRYSPANAQRRPRRRPQPPSGISHAGALVLLLALNRTRAM